MSSGPAPRRRRRRSCGIHPALLVAVALVVAGCATRSGPAPTSEAHASTGDEVFGLVGPETPQTLKRVTEAPYAPPDPRTCAEVETQLAGLDRLLGPDVDALEGDGHDQVEEWTKGALRGLIPYRGVVRFLTRASKREREMAAAILAGAARRGYLKGIHESLDCPARAEAPVASAPSSR